MKPKILMLLVVIVVAVAYLICFKVIVIRIDQNYMIFGTVVLACFCLYAFGYMFEKTDSDNPVFEIFLYLTPFSACMLAASSVLSSFEVVNFWHWAISVACAGISVAVIVWVAHSNRDTVFSFHYSEPHITKPTDNFVVGKVFLFILSLTVFATYLLVFNNSQFPFVGIVVNVNQLGLHTGSTITSFICFIFTVYTLGNKKFNKDYLRVTVTLTSLASFLLTIVLINGVDRIGDWIFSLIIAFFITALATLISATPSLDAQSTPRYQE